MGFFDKVLSKVGATLATKYGSVADGKYAGCMIALGNAPTEKVSVTNSFSQIIFLNENNEIARYNISDILDIKYLETITFPATGQNGYRCQITFPTGETCVADLFPSKMGVFFSNTNIKMLDETLEFFKKELA